MSWWRKRRNKARDEHDDETPSEDVHFEAATNADPPREAQDLDADAAQGDDADTHPSEQSDRAPTIAPTTAEDPFDGSSATVPHLPGHAKTSANVETNEDEMPTYRDDATAETADGEQPDPSKKHSLIARLRALKDMDPEQAQHILDASQARMKRAKEATQRSVDRAVSTTKTMARTAAKRTKAAYRYTERQIMGDERVVIPYDPADPPRPRIMGERRRIVGVPFAQFAKWSAVGLVLIGYISFLLTFLLKTSLTEPLFVDLATWTTDAGYAIGILLIVGASVLRRYGPRITTEDRQSRGLEGFILNRRVQSAGSVILALVVAISFLVDILAFLNAVGLLPFAQLGTVRRVLAIAHYGFVFSATLLAIMILHGILIHFHEENTWGRLRLARVLRWATLFIVAEGVLVTTGLFQDFIGVLHPINAIVLYVSGLTVLITVYYAEGGIESPQRPIKDLLRRFDEIRNLNVDWTIIVATVFGITSLTVVAIILGQGRGATGTQVPILYIVLFFIGVLGALVFIFFRLIKLGEVQKQQIARRKYNRQELIELGLIIGSATAALIFVLVATMQGLGAIQPIVLFGWEVEIFDYMAFTAFSATGPMSFYMYARKRRIKAMEDRFPELLRDIAEGRRAGLTLVSALRSASYGDYGTLTPEIEKMANQLSWGVSFDRVMTMFRDRIHTPLIDRSVSLILEAGKAGGRVTDVLNAAARDAREIRLLQRDRHLTMSTYVMIVYVAALVFLVVVAIMGNMFVPRIVEAGESIAQIGDTAGFSGAVLPLSEYIFFYFGAAIVQSLGSGLVAGTLEDGQIVSGFRHAFSLMLVSYIIFRIFVL